jgi:hypothetical protein
MARRASEKQRRPERQNVVLQEEAPESDIEPMDVTMGLVFMFVIPAGVWLLLLLVGYPVNGNPPMSAQERLVRKEKMKTRKPPPFDESEYKVRSDRVDDLLNRYLPKYRSLSHKEEEPVPKHYYYECAQKCLQKAETELKELQTAVKKSSNLRPYEQSVVSRLNSVSQLRHDLLKEKVFLNR